MLGCGSSLTSGTSFEEPAEVVESVVEVFADWSGVVDAQGADTDLVGP